MKTKSHLVIILSFMLFSFVHSYAQPCQIPAHSFTSAHETDFNRYVIRFKAQGEHLNTDLKLIPTVIHVIYRNSADSQQITLARIQGQIDATNKQLRRLNANAKETRKIFLAVAADCNVQVCLATRKPDRSRFNGVIYYRYPDFQFSNFEAIRAATILDPERYLNVWVIPGFASGEAVFPWQRTPTYDGFYIGAKVFGTTGSNLDPSFKLGVTFTHELGHYLGLEHTFQNSQGLFGRCDLIYDATIGDFCADTPLDPEVSFIGSNCNKGVRACDPPPAFYIAQTENYMAYNPDKCLNMFSLDQRVRIRACLQSLRRELASPSNRAFTGTTCNDLRENCNGCADAPLAFAEANDNDLQVAKPDFEKKISIFPNPTNGVVHIIYYDLIVNKDMSVRVYNQLGQMLKEVHSKTAINELSLDAFSEGVYYLRITIDNSSVTKYLIKTGSGNISDK